VTGLPWLRTRPAVDEEDVATIDRVRAAAAATAATGDRLEHLREPATAAFRAAVVLGAKAPASGIRARMRWLPRLPQTSAVRFATLLVAVGLLTSAGATALASSGPGQALYPARLSVESTLLVAFQAPGTSDGRLAWLERRLDEAESARRSGSDAAVRSALAAYADGLAALARDPADRDRILAPRIDDEIVRLVSLEAKVDEPGGRDIVRRALRDLGALRSRIDGAAAPAGGCGTACPGLDAGEAATHGRPPAGDAPARPSRR
jgi:hypothetical protein